MRDKRYKLDTPEPFKECFGCGQHPIAIKFADVQKRVEHIYPVLGDPDESEAPAYQRKHSACIPIPAISYDMRALW